MNEVGAADRTRHLRLKEAQLSGIVTSRKRKLRELYAVCDNEFPIPQIDLTNPNAPPCNIREAQFLECNDILRERLFDESNLPTRRRLRSDKSKETSPVRKATSDTKISDVSRNIAKLQRDGSRQSRAGTPSSRSDGGISTAPNENVLDGTVGKGVQMQRSSSKSSQTDLPVESSAVLKEIVEETFENAKQPTPSIPDDVVQSRVLENDRIRTRVESRPNSPGMDPRQAMPISAEDAANLPGPLVEGLGSHDGQHKAATIHLPPRDVQERRLQQLEKAQHQREHTYLSINPPRDTGRNTEAISSPGSTNDALSTTTPGMHEASTDTSPDNESRYGADRMDKDEEAATPAELKPSPEEAQQKAEHDRILQARMDIAREEILRSGPNTAEEPDEERSVPTSTRTDCLSGNETEQLTKSARGILESRNLEEDSIVDVGIPEDKALGLSNDAKKAGKQPEIADSEEEPTSSAEAMEVDEVQATVKDGVENKSVKDSFESSSAFPSPSVAAPQVGDVSKGVSESQQTSVTPTTPTPRRTPSTPAVPAMERMTTRVASGAMRHKSVSEILGETPKPSDRRIDSESGNSHTASRSSTPQSPGARLRQLDKTNKERSKLSTVVFAGRPSKPPARDYASASGSGAQSLEDDYFMPLFLANASQNKRPSLESLIQTAHKTITTSNSYLPLHDHQSIKVLKRIYQLQSANKWALRQPKRAIEPVRQTTHCDVMLQEMRWMRTDFREERKWKMAVARNLASACAEWVEASPEDRKLLQIKATIPRSHEPELSKDVDMAEGSSPPAIVSTPDLVASGASDSAVEDFEEEPGLSMLGTVAPAAIFALQDDEVVCGLRNSPITDKLLAELPMYGAPLRIPQSNLPTSAPELDPDRVWKRPALPLSKYVEGRMELKVEGPPRKKSRFEYDEEDDDGDQVVFGEQGTKRAILPAENSDVALFNPDNKHIRDRIHSAHQFRPPSEFPMPLQTFFENRTASQWTADEDVELKTLVREYQYNWSLISSMLTSKSMWIAGPERRTPWECFERWINLEGLPADMQKTHYFRAYSTRIDTANRNVMNMPTSVAQANASGQVQPTPRRRPTTSIRVERRRNNKHLTLVDAMRKLAKKRETNIQKQQHAAGLAAMRKAQEPAGQHPGNRIPVQTPQEFSRLKADREEQFRIRLEELQRRQDQQRRALLQQQRNGPQIPQQLAPGATPRSAVPGAVTNGLAPSVNQNLAVPGQNRPRPMPPQMNGQPLANGIRVPQMVPPAQMQGQLPLPNPALDVGLVTRAHQISQHQQAILRQQQGQMNGQTPQMHNSPPRMNGMPQPGFNMPPNMMPPFNPNVNGVATPPTNGHPPAHNNGQSGSPHMGQNLAPPPNMNLVQMLENNFRQKYPQATPDQISRLMTDHISNASKQQQRQGLAQSAMNAAAGGSPGNGMPVAGMGPAQNTPQLYAQMLRQQQENQQKAQQQAAQQAANAVANGQNQAIGNPGPGHAHRASTGSAHSGK